jgi:UDP-MurNAc hydroxylase
MKFQIVGHACLSVEAAGRKLVVDPWILGPVYWDAWWHCPEPVFDEGIFRPDFVYITHWHFDHIHPPSLRRFDKSCTVLLPRFPVSSLPAQVRSLGFERVVELEHGRPFRLADGFTMTSYQIQYQDDSACVIEAEGTVLVDLNDAKPLPRTWKRLRRRHPRVDFMLRSHSPAWSYPSAYTFDDPADAIPVDKQSYLQAFRNAAAVLSPRFAIPFASSVCHLHAEVLGENAHLGTPYDLERYWSTNPVAGTELVRMPHGSTWSDRAGFDLTSDEEVRDLEGYVRRRIREESAVLEATYAREKDARIEFEEFAAFFRRFLRRILPLRPFLAVRWLFEIEQGGRTDRWLVDVRRGRVEPVEREPERITSRIRVHPAVLADALREGVFTNIDISKRWRVHIGRGGLTKHLVMWVLVSLFEAGSLDARNVLRWRFLAGWFRRRSEILDYLAVSLAMLRKGKAAAAQAVTEPL